MIVFCKQAKCHMTTSQKRGHASGELPPKSAPVRDDSGLKLLLVLKKK